AGAAHCGSGTRAPVRAASPPRPSSGGRLPRRARHPCQTAAVTPAPLWESYSSCKPCVPPLTLSRAGAPPASPPERLIPRALDTGSKVGIRTPTSNHPNPAYSLGSPAPSATHLDRSVERATVGGRTDRLCHGQRISGL